MNTTTSESRKTSDSAAADRGGTGGGATCSDIPTTCHIPATGHGSTTDDSPATAGYTEDRKEADGPGGPAGAKATDPVLGHERHHVLVENPFGRLYVVAARGSVVGIYHEDHDPTPGPTGLGQPLHTPHGRPVEDVPGTAPPGTEAHAADTDVLRRACRELGEYFEGRRRTFSFPVKTTGTAFQEDVWKALVGIPFGERRSYRDIAGSLGNPAMGRAIGAAVRANPLSIVIPGHRVVGSSGKVVGYAAGTGVKSALLDFERFHCVAPRPTAADASAVFTASAPAHRRETSRGASSGPGRG